MLTFQDVDKTLKNKRKAIKKAFEMFPSGVFSLTSDSFNSKEYSSFRVYLTDYSKFADIADYFYVKRATLFEYGSPRIINKNYWIYKSDFIVINLYIHILYNRFESSLLAKGNITVRLDNTISCGIKDWEDKYKILLSLLDNNKNEELVKKYKDEITKADIYLSKWRNDVRRELKECSS